MIAAAVVMFVGIVMFGIAVILMILAADHHAMALRARTTAAEFVAHHERRMDALVRAALIVGGTGFGLAVLGSVMRVLAS